MVELHRARLLPTPILSYSDMIALRGSRTIEWLAVECQEDQLMATTRARAGRERPDTSYNEASNQQVSDGKPVPEDATAPAAAPRPPDVNHVSDQSDHSSHTAGRRPRR